jgi:hypothetical protein
MPPRAHAEGARKDTDLCALLLSDERAHSRNNLDGDWTIPQRGNGRGRSVDLFEMNEITFTLDLVTISFCDELPSKQPAQLEPIGAHVHSTRDREHHGERKRHDPCEPIRDLAHDRRHDCGNADAREQRPQLVQRKCANREAPNAQPLVEANGAFELVGIGLEHDELTNANPSIVDLVALRTAPLGSANGRARNERLSNAYAIARDFDLTPLGARSSKRHHSEKCGDSRGDENEAELRYGDEQNSEAPQRQSHP